MDDAALGRVDELMALLKKIGLTAPEKLAKYVAALHANFEQRPISEQIIDQLLAEDSDRYRLYDSIRGMESERVDHDATENSIEQQNAIGEFMAKWIEFEKFARETFSARPTGRLWWPSSAHVSTLTFLDNASRSTLDRLRRFRNALVHGIDVPSAAEIRESTREMQNILDRMRQALGPSSRKRGKKKAGPDPGAADSVAFHNIHLEPPPT